MLELSNTETLIILSSISIFAYIVSEIILIYSMRRKNRLSKILQINNFGDFLGNKSFNFITFNFYSLYNLCILSIFIACIIYVSLFNYYILIAIIVTIVLVVTKAKLYKYAKGE